jgi:hypothetical protein
VTLTLSVPLGAGQLPLLQPPSAAIIPAAAPTQSPKTTRTSTDRCICTPRRKPYQPWASSG